MNCFCLFLGTKYEFNSGRFINYLLLSVKCYRTPSVFYTVSMRSDGLYFDGFIYWDRNFYNYWLYIAWTCHGHRKLLYSLCCYVSINSKLQQPPTGHPRAFELMKLMLVKFLAPGTRSLLKSPAKWKDLISIVPAPGTRKNSFWLTFSFNLTAVIFSLTKRSF